MSKHQKIKVKNTLFEYLSDNPAGSDSTVLLFLCCLFYFAHYEEEK